MSKYDQLTINTVRLLSADGVQAAKSGHPGMPLGAAPMAYTLWARHLKANGKDPKWADRDRFVLSAGHASMLIYSLLHLFGYDVSMDDLKSFRQLGSRAAGHPEYGHTPGVEVTTGPLGQGVANAVGMAMSEAHLASVFNRDGHNIVDHYTYAVTGDGCLMEGVSSEAASLAGTLGLGKLIVLYDSNAITIEGATSLAFTEDVLKRFEAYGWQTLEVADGNDVEAVDAAIRAAKEDKERPSFIKINTKIGYGSPVMGKAKAHGEPLGDEGLKETKRKFGFDPEASFVVPEEVKAHMLSLIEKGQRSQQEWEAAFQAYEAAHPELAAEYKKWNDPASVPAAIAAANLYEGDDKPDATRNSSSKVLNKLAEVLPNLMGGSADLGPSNKSVMNSRTSFGKGAYGGSNIHFGVREHAMAAIANGMAAHGGLVPYVATFFVFSDYLKPSVRLSALMKLPVTYVLTHDSIGVGEDGPTHQPIEHLAAIRSMPGAVEFRPADYKETAAGWTYALTGGKPTALVLTRQNLPQYPGSGEKALKGGYVLAESEKAVPDVVLIASGSEVELIYKAKEALQAKGVDARVVSMPSMTLFEEQSQEYKQSVLPDAVTARVAVEAASSFGWHRYAGAKGAVIALDRFGESAPAPELFKEFGFTVENVVQKALEVLKK